MVPKTGATPNGRRPHRANKKIGGELEVNVGAQAFGLSELGESPDDPAPAV